MSSVTFDTLKFVERLEAGGFSHDQAKAAADAFSDALRDSVVTQAGLHEALQPIKTDVSTIKLDVHGMKYDLLKWMIGIAVAEVAFVLGILGKFITH